MLGRLLYKLITKIQNRGRITLLKIFHGAEVGRGVRIAGGSLFRLDKGARLILKDKCYVGPNCSFFLVGDSRITLEAGSAVREGSVVRTAAPKAKIVVGENAFVGSYSVIEAKESIEIGDDACVAEHVTIRDQDHGKKLSQLIRSQGYLVKKVKIGRDSWLGAKSVILMCEVGDKSVVGAHSFVNRNVEEGTIVAGIPARMLKKRE